MNEKFKDFSWVSNKKTQLLKIGLLCFVLVHLFHYFYVVLFFSMGFISIWAQLWITAVEVLTVQILMLVK